MNTPLPVLILAGGLAKRVRPITNNIPKSLIEINGKPFINWQLKYLSSQGIKKVILSIGYLGEKIENYVGNGEKYDLEVKYSYDGKDLLGTGGAIKKAFPLLEKNFFVLYGDVFLPIEYLKIENFFYQNKEKPLITIFKNDNRWDRSNIIYEKNRIIEYNKFTNKTNMKYIDYGLSILNKEIFGLYKEVNKFDLSKMMHFLSINDNLNGFIVDKRFYEIGSYDGIKETEIFLSNLNNISIK